MKFRIFVQMITLLNFRVKKTEINIKIFNLIKFDLKIKQISFQNFHSLGQLIFQNILCLLHRYSETLEFKCELNRNEPNRKCGKRSKTIESNGLFG